MPDAPSGPSTGWGTDRLTVRSTRRGFLAGLAAAPALGGIPPALDQQGNGDIEWTHYHGGADRTAWSSTGDPNQPTRTRWTIDVPTDGSGDGFRTAPVVAGGTAFTANADGDLVAIDLASGTVEWSHAVSGSVQIAPAVDGDRVFLGTSDGEMVALGRGNGDEQWSTGVDTGVSTPAVRDGRVYFGHSGADRAEVLAFDAASGDLVWQTRVSKTGSLNDRNVLTTPTPAVAGETVVVNAQNLEEAGGSGLVGLDAANGTEQWQTSLGGTCYPPSTTADTCFAIGGGGVNRVAVADGSVRWQNVFEKIRPGAGARIVPGLVTVGEESVYVQEPTGIFRSGIVALDRDTGERQWTYRTDEGGLGTEISTTESRVYFVIRGLLVAVDPGTGLEEWTYRLEEADLIEGAEHAWQIGAAPIVTPEGVLAKHDGTVYAVDDGSASDAEGEPSGSPTPTAGGGEDGGGTGDADAGPGSGQDDGSRSSGRGFFTNDDGGWLSSFREWNLTVLSTLITVVATALTIVDMIRGGN